MLKKITVQISDFLFERGVVEVVDKTPKKDKKSLNRLDIQENVFDNPDAIADNSKMISLIMSMLMRMWAVMPDEQKELMSEQDKAMLDQTFAMFDDTITSADVAFSEEGMELVNRLLTRQGDIASILNA